MPWSWAATTQVAPSIRASGYSCACDCEWISSRTVPKSKRRTCATAIFLYFTAVYDVCPIFNPNLDQIAKQRTGFHVFIYP
jgi:hypothetical protein